MAQLNITHAGQTTTHALEEAEGTEYTLGQAEGNSFSFPNAQGLSPTHCRITKSADGFIIEDMHSESGITQGERKVGHELMLQDVTYTLATVELMLTNDSTEDTSEQDEAEAAEAAAPGSGEVKPRTPRRRKVTTGKKAGPRSAAALTALAEQYKRHEGLSAGDIVYIIAVLIAAFYAGMALYSWQHDGNPLPLFFR